MADLLVYLEAVVANFSFPVLILIWLCTTRQGEFENVLNLHPIFSPKQYIIKHEYTYLFVLRLHYLKSQRSDGSMDKEVTKEVQGIAAPLLNHPFPFNVVYKKTHRYALMSYIIPIFIFFHICSSAFSVGSLLWMSYVPA